ncbi:MAG TPA: hypothetical protein VIM11_10065 [Tepidisphaeraceae bacterium]|jgi:hypothetical protein
MAKIGEVFHIPKAFPPVLAVLGIIGLTFCAVSMFQSFGTTDTALTVDPMGRVWLTDQRYVGIHDGVVYDFRFKEGTRIRPVRMPKLVVRHVRKWGAVAPLMDTYSTRLGFSDLEERGVNSFSGAAQRSFPLWPLFIVGLLPSLKQLWLGRRRRAIARMSLCALCRYNLTGNTSPYSSVIFFPAA